MYLVRSGAAEQIEHLIHAHGENPMALIHRVGLRQAQFRDPDTYIAYQKLAELMEVSAAQCNNPFFGLDLAARQTIRVLGDLPMIVSRTPTVGEALTTVNKYLYLHASGVAVNQIQRGDKVRLHLEFAMAGGYGIDQLIQMSVAHLAMFMAGLLNVPRFAVPLYLRQPAPTGFKATQVPPYQQVRFGQAFDGLYFDAQQLESENHHDEASLNTHLTTYLKKLQSRYPNRLEDQVKDVISRLLPTGDCTVEWVASALGMHPRTLQSRLKATGTAYRELLQDTRRALAEQHLRYDTMSITDLALQLGYAEVAVFSRHFRLWTGLSPRQWRKSQREAALVAGRRGQIE